MKTQTTDPAGRRVAILVAVLAGIILVAAGAYTYLGTFSSKPVNGLKIIAAAHAYTVSMQQQRLPVPPSVPLQTLVDRGLLQPIDIGSLQGVDASINLVMTNGGSNILMRVHLADGAEIILLGDGSARQAAKR